MWNLISNPFGKYNDSSLTLQILSSAQFSCEPLTSSGTENLPQLLRLFRLCWGLTSHFQRFGLIEGSLQLRGSHSQEYFREGSAVTCARDYSHHSVHRTIPRAAGGGQDSCSVSGTVSLGWNVGQHGGKPPCSSSPDFLNRNMQMCCPK